MPNGASLGDAFDFFFKSSFGLPSVNGVTILPPEAIDASNALKLIDQRAGRIERHPDLVAAESDSDRVVNRLINARLLTIEDGRCDELVFRPFWVLFQSGRWKAVGRVNLVAQDQQLEASMFKSLTSMNLRESTIKEHRQGGIQFFHVRTFLPEVISAEANSHGTKPVGGNPGKYRFDEHIDQVIDWSWNSPLPSKKQVAEKLAELDFIAREKRPYAKGEIADDAAARAATDYLRLNFPKFWNRHGKSK